MIVDPAGPTKRWPENFVVLVSLRPDLVADLEPVLQLADASPAEPPGVLSDNNFARGIAAYRRGQFADALKWLDDWHRAGLRTGLWGGLAGCICAMSHSRRGEAVAAQADLEKASGLIEEHIQSGENEAWEVYGAAAVIRAEAERMILGREVSRIVDADWLTAARARWAPVRRHLNEGDRLALEKDWRGARNDYLAAIRDPAFGWEAAEAAWQTENSIPATKVGIVFLLAGDKTNLAQLCLDLLHLRDKHYAPGYTWHFLRTCMAGELDRQGELLKRVEEAAGSLRQNPGGVTPEAVGLIRAMAAYRSGRYQEAVDGGQIKGRLSVRNAARICRAMALARLGRRDEGRADLREAETDLLGPLKRLTGDHWWDLAVCQLLLDEAHKVFDGTN